jgi:hypothetical protein
LTKASVHPVLKTSSWNVFVLIQTELRVDRRCPHLYRRIIRCYCLRRSSSAISSDASTKCTVGSSDGTNFILPSTHCTNYTNAYPPMVSSVHPMVCFPFLSLLGFDPRKIVYLLNLACDIFASLGTRIFYKDMLNNAVSPCLESPKSISN